MEGKSAENSTNGNDEGNGFRENLEKILQAREKWVEVDDIDVSAGCPPGENFAGDVLRVVIYGRRLCLGVWTDIRKNFIIKKVPDPGSPSHGFYDCFRMFQNEITAYERILPMCQSYSDNKSRNETNDICFPRYYGQCQRFLVLQDLQAEGYQVVNRVKGFSKRECSVILQTLAKFHATSIAMRTHERVTFLKAVDKLKESVFRNEYIDSITGFFWENSVKLAIRSLTESKDPRLRKATETLRFYSGRVLSTLINLIKPDNSNFEVICHGDLWNNNILLKYCDSGYPIGVKFIDLQAMRYSSCVLDVMHVLFTSSRPVIYDRYFDMLLSEYYNSLVADLKDLETVPEFTFDEFMMEFKRKVCFGLFVACIMYTCITRTSAFEPPEPNLNINSLKSESAFEKMYRSLSFGYHERLRSLVLALVNSNLI